ncbi:MAG TPA: NAD(P)-binding domain-containing protein [Rhodopila sp.]|uniref:NAD(P)-binding domain-containing protein n=1 Tax=Rhodopila sp. TaxID=2480087 RepID=UPI002B73DBC8|nr:NAD(P)-binding domain-containing protein [Rhodopila sp.]HVY14990.1 NAD(P)-binding domain-containing protein [Rhodopila sp.]
MNQTTDVAIIGAGPYGLSLGAHLAQAGIACVVLGEPMHTWRTGMPEGMVLKSEGFASNLWHPDKAFTLQDYCAEHGLPYQDSGLPVPLATFSAYGVAFQKRFVPMLREQWVRHLDFDGSLYTLHLDNHDIITARRVVIAAGIRKFHQIPTELAPILGTLCSHSADHHKLDRFRGRQILVIGGGASGIGMAALMSAQGAKVSVAARKNRIAYCGPPSDRSLLEKIRAPESGLGTGWRSLACVLAPMVFYQMPRDFRHMIVRRHLGPAPGWTSRAEVEQNVDVLLGRRVVGSREANGLAAVTFQNSDGSEQTVEAEHVISATGYKVDMRRLEFLSREILDRMEMAAFTPVLSPYFETSVPGLFVVGTAAANAFGPLLRFAYGAGFASNRLSRFLKRTAERRLVPMRPTLAAAA